MGLKLEQAADAYADLPMLEVDALYESNLIENEKSMEALEDAIEAWEFAKKFKNNIIAPALLRDARNYVLGIHKLLGQRIDPEIAGKLRDCDVWIGGERKRFVDRETLEGQLDQWIIDCGVKPTMRKKSVEAREALAIKWHVAYEGLHPFTDINGRSGRILYQIQRLALGLPIKIIENATKHENYYPIFRPKVDEKFVEKMMKGLIEEGL